MTLSAHDTYSVNAHLAYAKTLSELRAKEDAIINGSIEDTDSHRLDATINSYYEIWKQIKTGVIPYQIYQFLRHISIDL